MARGGARPGAGRKKGGKEKPHISSYWSETDIKNYFEHLKTKYPESDRIATWIGDQLCGKAVQPISGDSDNPLTIQVVKYVDSDNST